MLQPVEHESSNYSLLSVVTDSPEFTSCEEKLKREKHATNDVLVKGISSAHVCINLIRARRAEGCGLRHCSALTSTQTAVRVLEAET